LSLQLVDQRKLFLATYLASRGSAVDRTLYSRLGIFI